MSIFTKFYDDDMLIEAPSLSPRATPPSQKQVRNKPTQSNAGQETPGEQAKRLNLIHLGRGIYGPRVGVHTHKSDGRRLIPLKPEEKKQLDTKVKKAPARGTKPIGSRNVVTPKTVKKPVVSPGTNNQPYEFSPITIKTITKKLENIPKTNNPADRLLNDRRTMLKDLMSDFITTTSYSKQVDIVKKLNDLNFIKIRKNGKKVYLSELLGLYRKYISGQAGNSVTIAMVKIIQDHEIPVPMQMSAVDKQIDNLKGTTMEIAVAAALKATTANKKQLEENLHELDMLGVDVSALLLKSKISAEYIKSTVPSGAKIVNTYWTDKLSQPERSKLGVGIAGEDPTDFVVEYKYASGKVGYSKISSKFSRDMKMYTLRNAGLTVAGKYLFGESGEELDELAGELQKKFQWKEKLDMPEEEKDANKRRFKEEYMGLLSLKLNELSKSRNGKKKMLDLWNKLNYCGKRIHTLIVHKKLDSNKIEIKPPNQNCSKDGTVSVTYNETSVVISLNNNDSKNVSISLKLKNQSDGRSFLQSFIRYGGK